jgi:hypothetical protein
MSANSSQRSASEILQQPLPLATKLYLDKLAATIRARDGVVCDDDLWTAQERLKGIAFETLRVSTHQYYTVNCIS